MSHFFAGIAGFSPRQNERKNQISIRQLAEQNQAQEPKPGVENIFEL